MKIGSGSSTNPNTFGALPLTGWVFVIYGTATAELVTATSVDGNVLIQGNDDANHLRVSFAVFVVPLTIVFVMAAVSVTQVMSALVIMLA